MKEDEITKMYLSSRNLNFLFLVKLLRAGIMLRAGKVLSKRAGKVII